MVLGIGEGKINLTLNGTTFSPGQTITGHLQLSMNEPHQARGLRVAFYGLQKQGKHTARVFETVQQLGPERAYQSGEQFDFSLTIPENALPPKIDGFFGFLTELFYAQPRWFVEASLDLPNKFDISGKQQIQLVRAVGTPSQKAEDYAKSMGINTGARVQIKRWGI